MYTWGRGDDGRLGHGDNGWKYVPRVVEALEGQRIVQVYHQRNSFSFFFFIFLLLLPSGLKPSCVCHTLAVGLSRRFVPPPPPILSKKLPTLPL